MIEIEKRIKEQKVKQFEKNKKNERERKQEYRNKLRMDEPEEKEMKLAQYKIEKEKLAARKAQTPFEIKKQKEEIITMKKTKQRI